ncbi:MAG: phage terminase large subunit, partial [Gammaproteobacteria bacterium]|nr:phage terminase large subunit [Gammaproteobacteria bacterium]
LATDENDALGREIGEPLWPERYDLPALLSTKTEVGIRDWIALYQQDPSDEEGAIFPLGKWKYYDPARMDFNNRFRTYQFWDTAFKKGQENDFSVGATYTKSPDGFVYARDWLKERMTFPELKKAAKALYLKWKPDVIYIEDKASGTSLFQELQSLGLPVQTYEPDGDKVVRAHAATPYIESGRILLPEGHEFLGEFLDEHAKFPAGAHDDIVDTTTMASAILAKYVELIVEPEVAPKRSKW